MHTLTGRSRNNFLLASICPQQAGRKKQGKNLECEKVPLQPLHFQRFSSFSTNASLDTIIGALEGYLHEEAIDFETEKDTTILGLRHSKTGSCQFRVSIFRTPTKENTNLLVEFNRVNGCMQTFNQLVTTALFSLKQHVTSTPDGKDLKKLPKQPLWGLDMDLDFDDEEFGDEKEEEEDPSALENILDFASSTQLDSQREGMRLLVSVCDDKKSVGLFTKHKMVKQIVALLRQTLSEDDCELLHLGSLLLMKLSHYEDLQKPLAQGLLYEMILLIEKNTMTTIEELYCRDVKRKVTEALANISEKNKDLVNQLERDNSESEEPLEDILERWNEADDNILRTNVQRIISALK